MVKINDKTKHGIIVITLIVLSFMLYIKLSTEDPMFTATMKDKDGTILAKDSASVPLGADSAQSLFGLGKLDEPFYLLSTVPSDPEKETMVQLSAVVKNPMDVAAYLKSVNVYKNGVAIYSEKFLTIYLNPDESYLYTSKDIDLEGLDGQKNVIKMDFMFEDKNSKTAVQIFEYNYLSLTPCLNDVNCKGENNVCDTYNIARLSTNSETYCTKACTAHAHCYVGQVCIQGRCGY
jgi:hypothetical protein